MITSLQKDLFQFLNRVVRDPSKKHDNIIGKPRIRLTDVSVEIHDPGHVVSLY